MANQCMQNINIKDNFRAVPPTVHNRPYFYLRNTDVMLINTEAK